MQVILASLIIFTLVIVVSTPLLGLYFEGQHETIDNWAEVSRRFERRAKTALEVVSAEGQQNDVQLVLRNTGSTRQADLESWDLILSYYGPTGGYILCWVPPEVAAPGGLWWRIHGLYRDAQQGLVEAFDHGILDPQEELVIDVRLAQPMMPGTLASVTASTTEGVQAWAVFEAQ